MRDTEVAETPNCRAVSEKLSVFDIERKSSIARSLSIIPPLSAAQNAAFSVFRPVATDL
ncbi:MAG: hypothetical protein ACN6O8_16820 [Achromobacter sp.]|uniref:hypothetical protein n=1 Tax=Achromobacter sp. TaxID=134375 RepID=UPI003D0335F9